MTTTAPKRTIVADLLRLAARLVEVGIDKDTAFVAAGRYLSGMSGWGTALMDARREHRATNDQVMAATRILNGWVIR